MPPAGHITNGPALLTRYPPSRNLYFLNYLNIFIVVAQRDMFSEMCFYLTIYLGIHMGSSEGDYCR